MKEIMNLLNPPEIRRKIYIDTLPKIAYHIETSPQTDSNIEAIKEILTAKPDLNFVVYFNHISYNDPLLAGHITRRLDPKSTRHMIAPASYSHTDPDSPKNKGFSFMIDEARRCGIEIIRVIQTYQIDHPDYGYSQEEAKITHTNFFRRIKDLRQSSTPSGCLISPEGHRSDTGSLGEPERGFLAIGRLLTPVIYIPLGIEYQNNFHRDSLNIGSHIKLSVGDITYHDDPNGYPNINVLMHNLALTLPPKNRSHW